MAKENHSGKKQPQLKVIDDGEVVHRLGNKARETSPPKKRALLRRTHETDAIVRDLTDNESKPSDSPENHPQESNAEPSTPSPPAPPVRIPPAIFILAASAFLLLLGVGVFLALGGRNRDSRHSMQERSRENLQSGLQEKVDAREIVAALTTTLQKYTSAGTIEEMLPFIRQPERVEPLMRDYYQTHPLAPQEGAELVSQFALPIENSSFVVLTAAFPDGSNRVFLAEADTDLNVTIDWESDACYQPVDVSEYIAQKPTNPVALRVFAQPDNFYVYDFSDSSVYQCLRMTFRDNDEILFGYVERDSPANLRLARHFQIGRQSGSGRPEPLYLSVRFLENTKADRGVLIEEFIAPRWANIKKSKVYE